MNCGWVLQAFLHLIKAGQGILGTFQVLRFIPLEKKTFTGYFSRSAHVFKLGSFVTLLGNDELGWSLFLGFFLQSSHWGDDVLQEEAEPLIIRDGTVTILVHRLEASVPPLPSLERSRQSKPLLVCRRDCNHRCKLVSRHLSIAISISGLEAFPAEPVDLLVALGRCVSNLLAVGDKGILVCPCTLR